MNEQSSDLGLDLAAHYRRRVSRATVVLVVVPATVLGVVGWLAGLFIPGVVVGVLAGAAVPYLVSRTSEQAVVAALGGVAADPVTHARVLNLLEGLCLVSGAARPEVRIVEGESPVALAAHESGSAGTIVVTTGLVSSLGRVEMEAVLAHLVARIRSGEVALATYVVALGMALSRIGLGVVGSWVRRATLEESAILAGDIAACRTTRYPPALVAALEAMIAAHGSIPAIPSQTAPLWFAVPAIGGATTGGAGVPIIDAFQPPLADRIAICKEI